MRASFINRIRVLALILLGVGVVLLFRLYTIQIINGESYRARAETQYSSQSPLHFDRGSIFFTARDGSRISAATLETGYTVALVPKEVTNVSVLYESLSQHLELDAEEFLEKAGKTNDPYEEIARRVAHPAFAGD